jgi:ATP-binding cassette subfamily F protein 3
VVFVSHDRYFIDRLATRVLEVEGGTVTSHDGNYEDYLLWKEAQAAGGAAPPRPRPSSRSQPVSPIRRARRRQTARMPKPTEQKIALGG